MLWEVARTYTDNNIHIYLNDKDKARVDELKKHLPQDECNFKIVTSCSDAYELLLTIGPQLYGTGIFIIFCFMIHMMRLLIGNHFAVFPKLGEVMINHMVSDPVRAISSARKGQQRQSMRTHIWRILKNWYLMEVTR